MDAPPIQKISPTTKFTDLQGNEWNLTITYGSARRIEEADFSDITNEPVSLFHPSQDFLLLMLSDPQIIFGLIWCIIQPDAEKRGIKHHRTESTETGNPDQVYYEDLIGGRSLEDAKACFRQAVTDFFQGKGTMINSLASLIQRLEMKITNSLTEKIPELETQLMEEIEQEMSSLQLM